MIDYVSLRSGAKKLSRDKGQEEIKIGARKDLPDTGQLPSGPIIFSSFPFCFHFQSF
jgi:hypothetical protein